MEGSPWWLAAHPSRGQEVTLDRLLWTVATTFGLVYLLLASKPLAPLRLMAWLLLVAAGRVVGRPLGAMRLGVWLYCPVCASPWLAALVSYVFGSRGEQIVVDALATLGVVALLAGARVVALPLDSWVTRFQEEDANGESSVEGSASREDHGQ